MRRIGNSVGLWGLESGQSTSQLGSLGGDPVEFGVELGVRESIPDGQGDRSPALGLETFERATEGDGVRLGDGSLDLALSAPVQLVKNVAWIAKVPFDVGPHGRLDRVGANRVTETPPGLGSALDKLAPTPIPPGALAERADVREATERAPH